MMKRGPISLFPDRGYHDDEDHWAAFNMSSPLANYVTFPTLGQGKSQRHTSKIKLYRVSINCGLNVVKSTQPETIGVQVILMWCHRPNGGTVPRFADVFTQGTAMDDTHNPLCAKMRHPMLKQYKVLVRRIVFLNPYTQYCSGRSRTRFSINLKFVGRNTKYVTFGEDSTGGHYSDISAGGLFYFCNFICSDANTQIAGDWNCRVSYFH